jgi:hypothetical protein
VSLCTSANSFVFCGLEIEATVLLPDTPAPTSHRGVSCMCSNACQHSQKRVLPQKECRTFCCCALRMMTVMILPSALRASPKYPPPLHQLLTHSSTPAKYHIPKRRSPQLEYNRNLWSLDAVPSCSDARNGDLCRDHELNKSCSGELRYFQGGIVLL